MNSTTGNKLWEIISDISFLHHNSINEKSSYPFNIKVYELFKRNIYVRDNTSGGTTNTSQTLILQGYMKG